jgi:iron complex transport system ATP-binding protein
MTVAQQSALLLLDEPVNHLDLRRRHEFFELVARMRHERGLAAVVVLHDVAEAYREADRVLVLDGQDAEEVPADDPRRVERLARAFGVPEERIPPL